MLVSLSLLIAYAFKLVIVLIGILRVYAKVFAIVTPILTPVKDPGPFTTIISLTYRKTY